MFNFLDIFRKKEKERVPVVPHKESGMVKLAVNATEGNKDFIRENLKVLREYDVFIATGDVVDVTYNFSITYLEGIERRLTALIALVTDKRTKAAITDMSVNELFYGKSIFLRLAGKIDQLLAERERGKNES
jgi:hypothetical protein